MDLSIKTDRNHGQGMSKKRVSDRVDEIELRRGGLAETNLGILLGEIVVSRSWTAVIAIIILVSIFVRAAVGLGGYSGTLNCVGYKSVKRC